MEILYSEQAIPTLGNETVRIKIRKSRGSDMIDVRNYHAQGFPTKDGVEVPLQQALALGYALEELTACIGHTGPAPLNTAADKEQLFRLFAQRVLQRHPVNDEEDPGADGLYPIFDTIVEAIGEFVVCLNTNVQRCWCRQC